MLFVLPDDLSLSASDIDAVENLMIAVREGKHLVFVPPQLATLLVNRSGLSQKSKGAVQKSASRAAELLGLKRIVSAHVELRADVQPIGVSETEGKKTIRMSLRHFSDSARSQKLVLLAENMTDARFYSYAAAAFVADRAWSGVKASVELRGGGGSTLPNEAEEICREGRLSVIVVDSDRRAPGGSIGPTARKAKERIADAFQTLIVLQSRECENLLSATILKATHESSQTGLVNEPLAVLLDLLRDVPGEWYRYIDIKGGVHLFDVTRMPEQSPEGAFWAAWWPKVAQRLKPEFQVCDCSASNSCKCVVWRGLGHGLLEGVVNFCSKSSPAKLRETLDLEDAEFIRVCETVVSWGCSMAPFVT